MAGGASKVDGEEATDPLDALLECVAQLTPVPHPATIRPLSELCQGRFEVLRRVGGGGMGVVYEALDRQRDTRVALKTLYHLDAQGIYRLKNEFRALSDVVHPNLVRLHELFVDEELWFFTMELVAGDRFDRWVCGATDEGREARLRSALGQLVAGVQRIHAAGKLHRDLKPSNVLVRPDGQVVILDFGLVADSEPGGAGQTLTDDHASGTPAYMAPEQAANAASTPASDWYAVGVMIFEALTGRLPFSGTAQQVMARKQLEDAPRVRSIASDVAPDLDALCAALLARDPHARPDAERIAALTANATPSLSFARKAATFEGRDAELLILRAAFAQVVAGQPVVLQVSGESGLGKSTLVTHFLEELRTRPDTVVLSGRCYEREVLPYNAFDRLIDELTRYLRHLPQVEAAVLLPRNIAALTRIFPVLARIEGVSSAPLHAGLDGADLRRRAFAACADLLGHIRDRSVLVLHIDDLQWLDLDSLLLLEHLLGLPEPIPMLLIATHRAPTAPLLARFSKLAHANRQLVARELVLAPLSPLATQRLAEQLLQGAPARAELVQVIASESRGSPFFVAELARYAIATGATTRSGISFEQALAVRVEELDDVSRDLLVLLAVSVRPTPLDVLARALDAGEVQHALDALRAQQLVRDAPMQHYECYHDRVRDAVKARLDAATERAQHARLVQAWESRANADPEVLFEHCQGAGMHAAAGAHAMEAALKAESNLAFERSAELFGHALALLSESEIERRNVRELYARALSLSGHWELAASAFDQARASCPVDSAKHSHLLRQAALHYLGSGHSREGLPRMQRVFRGAGIPWPRTRAAALLAAVFHLMSAWLRSARRLPHRSGRSQAELVRLEHLLEGASLLPPHDAIRGLYFMTKFASHTLRSGAEGYVAVALGMLSALFMGVPWWRSRARSLADEARLRACAEGHEPVLASGALSLAAFSYFADGRAHEALALTCRAEEMLVGASGVHVYSVWIARTLRAYGLLLLGRVADSEKVFEENAQLAREAGDTMSMLGADSPLRHLMRDDVAGARELLARKLAVLENIPNSGVIHHGVTVERLFCALYEGRGAEALGELAKHRGDAPMFFDMGMLIACCALQAPTERERFKVRTLEKTLRQLKRAPEGHAKQAHIAQFRAALSHLRGDGAATLHELGNAEQGYLRADMLLHATLMRLRSAQLRGGSEGERAARDAEVALVQLGIARPEGWARMFASGFDRVLAE